MIDGGGVGQALDDDEIGCGNSKVPEDSLRYALVQSDRQNERVGKRIGNPEGIQERRHLRFAAEAPQPFRNVENEVPAIALYQPAGKGSNVTDAVRRVAKRP